MNYLYFIGIDISKSKFDACIGEAAKPQEFSNDSEGFASFLASLPKEFPQIFVVLEATGGYETSLLMYLISNGISVHRADPLQAKHFTRSLGKRAKTDALDARALMLYGRERHSELALFVPKSPEVQELNNLLMRKDDLLLAQGAETVRLKHPRYASMKQYLVEMLDVIDMQLADIDRKISVIIADSEVLAAKAKILTSVKGVGKQTSAILLGYMPELGALDRRKIASLAGLAPHAKDSGLQRGYRRTSGGRAAVKRALYMAALSACRFNQAMKEFHQRLIKNGKKPMVALVAVARKLITILNAKLRDAQLQKTW
jgi:transposase